MAVSGRRKAPEKGEAKEVRKKNKFKVFRSSLSSSACAHNFRCLLAAEEFRIIYEESRTAEKREISFAHIFA